MAKRDKPFTEAELKKLLDDRTTQLIEQERYSAEQLLWMLTAIECWGLAFNLHHTARNGMYFSKCIFCLSLKPLSTSLKC